jgi:hypothetical protein
VRRRRDGIDGTVSAARAEWLRSFGPSDAPHPLRLGATVFDNKRIAIKGV